MKRGNLAFVDKIWAYQLHKSLGLTVAALMTVRVLWRLTHGSPDLPNTMSAWERRAAQAAHVCLYGLLLAMPLTGWLMVSAASLPVPTRLFGWLAVPHYSALAGLEGASRKLYEDFFKELHLVAAITLAWLAALHIAAALYHHFGRRDDVLRRMLPTWRTGRGGGQACGALLAGLLATALAGALVPHALAQEPPTWRIDPAKSSVSFEANAGGQAVKGWFERFAARIHFDPAAPARAGFAVIIESNSVATGTSEADEALKGRDWFDSARHPTAVFGSVQGERLTDGRYRVFGELTIKDKSRPLPLDFELRMAGSHASAVAELTIDRLDFGIGPSGAIAGMVVDNLVKVRIVIEAERDG